MYENKGQVSCNPTWDIIRLPRRRVCVDLCLEDKYEIIRRMKSIRYIFRLTCASWIPRLRTSGSKLGWDLGFEIGLTVGIVLGAPVGSPLRYYINMLLGLELLNSFGKSEGHLVGISLGPLSGSMIGTGEEYLVGLLLGLQLGSPLEYKILELILLALCWAILLGCGLALK